MTADAFLDQLGRKAVGQDGNPVEALMRIAVERGGNIVENISCPDGAAGAGNVVPVVAGVGLLEDTDAVDLVSLRWDRS